MSDVPLHELNEKHHQVAALIAQGLTPTEISSMVSYTKGYITWLTRDPLFSAYMDEMVAFSQKQVEVMFCGSVAAIGGGLHSGDADISLKAARLQLEVTGRIGKNERPSVSTDSLERLTNLAERLLTLQTKVRSGELIEGELIPSRSETGSQQLEAPRSGNRHEQLLEQRT